MVGNLIDVFKDTVWQYKNNPVLVESCRNTREKSQLYIEGNDIECERMRFQEPAALCVSRKRSFEAAAVYARQGKKTCVLNFANSFNPGGGVVHGARAQEECLCRISTLYDSLVADKMIEGFYDRHNDVMNELATDDLIYSPYVKVFKSDVDIPEMLPESQWFDVDVITCAAPDLYSSWDDEVGIPDSELAAIHEKRLRHILDAAVANGAEAMILGAFGCGAFGNPPEVVASVARKVLADYCNAFTDVEFAVYCSVRDSRNYEVFNKIFGN